MSYDIYNDGNAPVNGQQVGITLNKILGTVLNNGGGGGGVYGGAREGLARGRQYGDELSPRPARVQNFPDRAGGDTRQTRRRDRRREHHGGPYPQLPGRIDEDCKTRNRPAQIECDQGVLPLSRDDDRRGESGAIDTLAEE